MQDLPLLLRRPLHSRFPAHVAAFEVGGPASYRNYLSSFRGVHYNLVGKNRRREIVLCHTCGTRVEKQPCAVTSHNFCSRECFAKWRSSPDWSGSNNPAWLGGHDSYRGPDWERQTAAARRRDANTCQRCGRLGLRLPVHHVRPFRLFEDYREANRLSNLRTLCPECHGIEEQQFWESHPELVDFSPFPVVIPISSCVKCGREFVPRSGATKVCDLCCTSCCAHCRKSFYSRKAAVRELQYCSRECRNAHIKRKPQVCAGCGRCFVADRPGVKYCSQLCHLRKANPRKRYFEGLSGDDPRPVAKTSRDTRNPRA
ncbi:MAG: HNH endonuclease [Acidobacteria bacterium]|nr:HNH endonuclease [Acidobacteriota bacterium]